MIIDKVLLQERENKALTFESVSLTYGDLFSLIKLRAQVLSNFCGVLLINHSDPVKFTVDFLAAFYLGKKVIIGGADSIALKEYIDLPDWNLDVFEKNDFLNRNKDSEKFKFGVLSSGSEGDPHVIWRQNNEWEAAFEYQSSVFNISEKNKLFVLNALTYSANLNAVLHTLWNGGEVCFTTLKNAKNWAKEIKEKSIDSIFLVPSHWKLLDSSNECFISVTSCVSAGEKLDSKTCRQMMAMFTNATITEYYGASELGHISYQQNTEILENPLSVGRAFPGVELTIKNQKISVKSPYVSSEYKESGTVNDLGYLEEGRLVLLGRAGRMFNKRGVNIYAQEIEAAVQSHHAVQKSVLVKTQNNKLCLLYKLEGNFESIPKLELWSFLEEQLPKSKHPHFIKEVDYLPLTQSGKIDYQELQQSYESQKLIPTV